MIHRKLNDIRDNLLKKVKRTSSMSFHVLIMKADLRGLQDTSNQQDYSKGLYYSSQNIFN